MRVRRAVLGDGHVDAATAATTPFDHDFQRFVTEVAWAGVWDRPDLDRRTRRLVTIALLAALGREEVELHLRAALRDGVSHREILEALLHVAVYAGLPAANDAVARAKRIIGEESAG